MHASLSIIIYLLHTWMYIFFSPPPRTGKLCSMLLCSGDDVGSCSRQVIEASGMCREDIEAIGRQQGLVMDGLGEHLPSVPGGTLRRTNNKGLFATIRQAGNRAHARFEFWRKRNRRQGGGAAIPDPAADPAVGGVLQSIRRFWGGAAKPTGRGTRKVAVAPAARPF